MVLVPAALLPSSPRLIMLVVVRMLAVPPMDGVVFATVALVRTGVPLPYMSPRALPLLMISPLSRLITKHRLFLVKAKARAPLLPEVAGATLAIVRLPSVPIKVAARVVARAAPFS